MPEQKKDAIHIIDQALRNLEILKIELSREETLIFLGDSEANLTFKERTVLQLTAEGKVSKQIAGAMFMGNRSIENFKANILRKLQANTMPHAIAIAFKHKILQ